MFRKITSILLFIAVIVIGYTQKDLLLIWIKEGGMLSVLISLLLVAIDVFFPIVPFALLAGIIGNLYGVWQGTAITLTGSMIGTMILFFLARYGFRDWFQHYVDKYPKVKEYELQFEKNSFLAIFLSRAIPVIPSFIVNAICGLSNVKWSTFFLASFIGKIPNNLLVNFVGASFSQNKWFSLGVYGGYTLIIFIINYIIVYKKLSRNEPNGAVE